MTLVVAKPLGRLPRLQIIWARTLPTAEQGLRGAGPKLERPRVLLPWVHLMLKRLKPT